MNKHIIDEFEKLIEQINYDLNNSETNELRNKHYFRLRTIRNAVKIIKKYKSPINNKNDVDELKNIKGISSGIIRRINEILDKGQLSEISEEIRNSDENINTYVSELENVINIGRKTAIDLVNKGITSVKQLIQAVASGKIDVNDEIKLGLKYYGLYDTTIPREEITLVDKYLQKVVKKMDPKIHLVICGSYRRNADISSDIDVLITHEDIKKKSQITKENNVLAMLVDRLIKEKFIVDNLTRNHVTKYMGFARLSEEYPIRRIDIRYFAMDSYYTAILYFTGSKEFNEQIRRKAMKLKYKLNEYGLYKRVDDKYMRVKIKSEKDIFDVLNVEYLEPKDR
jgi:DNA polymerase beta